MWSVDSNRTPNFQSSFAFASAEKLLPGSGRHGRVDSAPTSTLLILSLSGC